MQEVVTQERNVRITIVAATKSYEYVLNVHGCLDQEVLR